jgi:dTDP-4-dehydrorhamnose reductase
MHILVTGSCGQLGQACLEALPAAGHAAIGVDRQDGDLSAEGVAADLIARHGPDWVIHTAAYTAVDLAESDRDAAKAANAQATALLAAECRERRCGLTYLSTDYVFAGNRQEGYREDAPLEPINWYGRTKAMGEAAVGDMAGDCPRQIVRTSWLFGHGSGNFVLAIIRRLEAGETLRVVDDQRGCPTYAPDLAALLARLITANATGCFHVTNRGVCTWFEFAREIAMGRGHDPKLVQPCTTAEYPTAARRPAFSVLLDTRLDSLGLGPLPPWRDALARYLCWLDESQARGTP